MRKRVLLGISVLALAATLIGCGQKKADESKKSADADVLRVGMECGYAPYNWTQSDDSNGAVEIEGSKEFAGGYDVEMAKKVAEALNKKLVIVKTDWDGLPPAVQSGKIDAVMAGMSPTAERSKEILFTEPYYVSDYVMIVKKDSPYANATSLADFKDAKITGQLNTVHYDIIDQIPGVNKQEPKENFPQLRVALQSGVIDGYVGEIPEGKSVEEAMPEFKMIKFEDGKGFEIKDNVNRVAAGLKLGSEDLKAEFDKVFSSVTEDERQKIMDEAIAHQPSQN